MNSYFIFINVDIMNGAAAYGNQSFFIPFTDNPDEADIQIQL